jgi:hypothetical protein
MNSERLLVTCAQCGKPSTVEYTLVPKEQRPVQQVIRCPWCALDMPEQMRGPIARTWQGHGEAA